MNKNLVLIVMGVATLIVAPLVIWGIISFSQAGTKEVKLVVVPADSLVRINNKEFKGEKSIRLEPGKYAVGVSKDGFKAVSQELIVEEDKETTFVSLLLAESQDALKWSKNNQRLYLEAEKVAGIVAVQQGEEFINKYPITKWLPLQNSTFVIGYKQASEDKNKIIITITATEGYREAALQEIREKGADPSDYVIEFNNYRNPFNV